MENWTKEIPESRGHYWFYGDPFSDRLENNEYIDIYLVKIRKNNQNGNLTFISEGHFMDNKIGYWMEAILPEIPNEEN